MVKPGDTLPLVIHNNIDNISYDNIHLDLLNIRRYYNWKLKLPFNILSSKEKVLSWIETSSCVLTQENINSELILIRKAILNKNNQNLNIRNQNISFDGNLNNMIPFNYKGYERYHNSTYENYIVATWENIVHISNQDPTCLISISCEQLINPKLYFDTNNFKIVNLSYVNVDRIQLVCPRVIRLDNVIIRKSSHPYLTGLGKFFLSVGKDTYQPSIGRETNHNSHIVPLIEEINIKLEYLHEWVNKIVPKNKQDTTNKNHILTKRYNITNNKEEYHEDIDFNSLHLDINQNIFSERMLVTIDLQIDGWDLFLDNKNHIYHELVIVPIKIVILERLPLYDPDPNNHYNMYF